jgi:trans-2,3-dihydro-3-hydroxyanthranilate isomerase
LAHALTWLDVFTATPLQGNGLCVVHDADDLDDEVMLAMARETRLSETTFVQASRQEGADYRNRIFTTMGELPFAGHPSLGTAVAVARVHGQRSASYVQETWAGCQPVEVELAGERARASMLQEPAVFGPELHAAEVAAAVGLAAGDAHPSLPAQVVSTGTRQVLLPVADATVLARPQPRRAALAALLRPLDAVVLYLAALDLEQGRARARSFFLDPQGTVEDPATGSAAGPLLAYLHAREGLRELTVAQGEEMGRPSSIDCRLEGERVRVGGHCVVVADGTLLR